MSHLENIIKGSGVGLALALDPIGSKLSSTDYLLTGIGPSDKKNALPTISNLCYQGIYKNPEKNLSGKGEYASRLIGSTIGTTTGLGILGGIGIGTYSSVTATSIGTYAGLTTAISAGMLSSAPFILGAATIPAAFGLYSIIASGVKYIQNFTKGENGQKAKFSEGLKLGYEQSTSFLEIGHRIESYLTGRGQRNSHIKSPIQESAKKTKRNFASVLGNICGRTSGTVLSIGSLGIIPIYKTMRDIPKAADNSKYTVNTANVAA